MKKNSIVAFLFVLIWMSGKLLFFKFNVFQTPQTVKFMVMWNLFCAILAMTIGAIVLKRSENKSESTALGDIKSFISTGLIYGISVSILLFVYYKKIDPNYNLRQQESAKIVVEKSVSTPKKLELFKKENPSLNMKSKEEILELAEKNYKSMYSAGTTATVNLLSMLLLSVVNGIVLTAIFRRVLNKAI
jgi:hypothetical protein